MAVNSTFNPFKKRLDTITSSMEGMVRNPTSTTQVDETTSVTEPVVPASPSSPASPRTKYLEGLQKRLSGQDPVVQSAQNQAQAATAASRYLANRGAAQTSAQAGFGAGTLQSQRVQDRYSAQAAGEGLGIQNQLNQLTRQRSDEAMSLARDTITPQTTLEGLAEAIRVGNPTMTPEQIQSEALRQYNLIQKSQIQPLETESQAVDAGQLQQQYLQGAALTPEQTQALAGSLNAINFNEIPTGAALDAWKLDNPVVKIDGQVYRVGTTFKQTRWKRGGGFSDRHREWTSLEGPQGTIWVGSNGRTWNSPDGSPPPSVPGGGIGDKISLNADGQFYTTNGRYIYDANTKQWVSTGAGRGSQTRTERTAR